jgi:hypothetical protein
MYGEGDFKKSILYAVNCGDDTDCTAGTVGAILGIMGGTKAIPEDYKAFVGDGIATMSINGSYYWLIPKTCSELTQRVYKLVPNIMEANAVEFEFTDEDIEPKEDFMPYYKGKALEVLERSKYSYKVDTYRQYSVVVEFDKHPRVKSGDERKITLTFEANHKLGETRKFKLKIKEPSGWKIGDYQKTVSVDYPQHPHGLKGMTKIEFAVTVGEDVDAVNRIYVEATTETIPYPMIIPIVLLG